MSFWQAVFEALESLNGNKLRSGLTVLGIVIGVAAVIAMLAVGNGAQASITGSISSIGTNLVFVFSGAPSQNGTEWDTLRSAVLRCTSTTSRKASTRTNESGGSSAHSRACGRCT